MHRYIITGAPGAGKTTVLSALADRGYAVVPEAATDIIIRAQALGREEDWQGTGFVESIAALQRERQLAPAPAGTTVQLYDRSPVCTLALARYGGQEPVPAGVLAEVARVVTGRVYRPAVFLLHLLGFMTPTPVRRISYPDAVTFEHLHRQAYTEHGYDLVEVPPGPVGERADLIESYIH